MLDDLLNSHNVTDWQKYFGSAKICHFGVIQETKLHTIALDDGKLFDISQVSINEEGYSLVSQSGITINSMLVIYNVIPISLKNSELVHWMLCNLIVKQPKKKYAISLRQALSEERNYTLERAPAVKEFMESKKNKILFLNKKKLN